MNHKIFFILFLVALFSFGCESQIKLTNSKILLDHSITCTFQEGQSAIAKQFSNNYILEKAYNSTPLIWEFNNLFTDKSSYSSGGDVGPIYSLKLNVGVQPNIEGGGAGLFLPQDNGGHLFTIWANGTAYWTKHNSIMGTGGVQTFLGECKNR
ncbi:hypothetical protein K1X76_10075 [bacterium]|nr:hypothetical protein [bacterium]